SCAGGYDGAPAPDSNIASCTWLLFSTMALCATGREPVLLLLAASGLTRLAGLHTHDLARIADALALVWLWLADRANVRCDLSHELLVDAGDRHLVRPLDREGDAFGRNHLHRMRVADLEDEVLSNLRHAVADALKLQRLREAILDAVDHVGQQRTREAMQRAHRLAIVWPRDSQRAIAALLDLERCREGALEGSLWPRHGDGVIWRNLHLDAG